MKRKVMLIIAAFLAFWLVAFIFLPIGRPYDLPFAAEDVSCLTVSNVFSGYKVVEKEEDIAEVVERINRIALCSVYDPEKDDGPEEGSFGCSICIELKNGRQYDFIAIDGDGLKAFFTDETGTTYKVRNFQPIALWNQLEAELRPFQTE